MSKNNRQKSNWLPEIMYEEESQIPFIEVPESEQDPALLFIFINRRTGETEPGSEGEEVPVVEMDLRQFVDMKILKERLTETEYDKVRSVLGLLPLREAMQKGKQITANVEKNVTKG
jgi:hypothetical protein